MKTTCVIAVLATLGLGCPMGAQSQASTQQADTTAVPPAVAGADQAPSQAAVLWESLVTGGAADAAGEPAE
jgi:hypothetical protein